MFKFLRATILLVTVFAGLLYCVRLFGGTQPDPLASWFTAPDGSACSQPCLFGITPGVTMYKDAVQMLAQHPFTRDMKQGRLNDDDPDQDIGLADDHFCLYLTNSSTGTVSEITLSTQVCYFAPTVSGGSVTLGQFVAALGNPDAAMLGNYGVAPDYYYFDSRHLVFVAWNENVLCNVSPLMAYEGVSLVDYDTSGQDTLNWKGFASRKRYSASDFALAKLGDCKR